MNTSTDNNETNTTSLIPDGMSSAMDKEDIKQNKYKTLILGTIFFLVFLAVGYVQAARADGLPNGTQIAIYSQVPNGFPTEVVPVVGYQLQFANRVDYPTGRTVFTVTYGINKPVSLVVSEMEELLKSKQWGILGVKDDPGVGVIAAQSNSMNLSATIVPDVSTITKITIQVEVN